MGIDEEEMSGDGFRNENGRREDEEGRKKRRRARVLGTHQTHYTSKWTENFTTLVWAQRRYDDFITGSRVAILLMYTRSQA